MAHPDSGKLEEVLGVLKLGGHNTLEERDALLDVNFNLTVGFYPQIRKKNQRKRGGDSADTRQTRYRNQSGE
jgi:hypothetical protein